MDILPTLLHDKGLALKALWAKLPESASLKDNVFFNQSATIVWAYSDYVATVSLQRPAVLVELFISGDIERVPHQEDYQRALEEVMAQNPSLETLMQELRRLRTREMVRFVWQRVMALQNPRDIARLMSEFAQAVLNVTIAYLSRCHYALYGMAVDKNEEPCILYVLGLGKLGGYDLNFSSDIDIVFTYFTPHHWQGTRKEWDPNQYFSKLVQTVVKVLSEVTADGFVFRVDLRLRPFGQSGPVVMSYTAMEQYYQQHGREWERYALIKARVLNKGPTEEIEMLQSLLQRFSYRRYVDYSVIEALRKLKGLMDKQVQEDAAINDIKLGRGGLREIEFIVQTFQLLKGGKDKRLQTSSLYKAMRIIAEEGWLPSVQVTQLREDYDCLRSIEDSLQMIGDRQTQSYPTLLLDQMRLAWIMGHASWSDFMISLEPLRGRVSSQFESLFLVKGQRESTTDLHTDYFFKLWNLQTSFADWALHENRDEAIDWTELTATLTAFRNSHIFVHLSKEARLRLDQLMPLVLAVVVQGKTPDLYLQRFLKVIAAVVRRSTYLSLLIENKNALFHLIQCCGQSVWMSEQLTQYPILLDSLLDRRLSLLSLDQAGLESRLEQALLAIPEEDTEAQLEILRQIKNEYTLQAAMAYLTTQDDDDNLSIRLSEVAVAFLNVVAQLAWRWVREKYTLHDVNDASLPPWAIVAYGTLGGREMGFQSDLDLVFLYDNGAAQGLEVAKQQQRAEYSYQWARRVVYWLELKTYNGYLYKVDTALRPSGEAGLLVSDITHFATYQMTHAWLWEHQALLRARVVAGNTEMAVQFARIRHQALARPRNLASLRQDILAMRQRMLSHTPPCPTEKFDLKQGVGGLIDLEFMIQFLALSALTAEVEALSMTSHHQWLQWVGGLGKISTETVRRLLTIERLYRRELNQASLQNMPLWVNDAILSEERAIVQNLWQILLLRG